MRGAEGVVLALGAPGKARQASHLPQRSHALAPARQDLVRIGLMADVPDQPVMRRVEHVMQCDGEFHGAEVGTQVAAGPGHAVKHVGTQFVGNSRQLRPL